jgi:hypothetical protein
MKLISVTAALNGAKTLVNFDTVWYVSDYHPPAGSLQAGGDLAEMARYGKSVIRFGIPGGFPEGSQHSGALTVRETVMQIKTLLAEK